MCCTLLAIAKVCTIPDICARILDVGAAGICLRRWRSSSRGAHFTAADLIRKKITVVEGVTASLGLEKPHAPLRACVRVETLKERFDYVAVSRADGHAGVCEAGLP